MIELGTGLALDAGCVCAHHAGGSQTVVVAHAAVKPDIGSLASELESTLTNVAVSFQHLPGLPC